MGNWFFTDFEWLLVSGSLMGVLASISIFSAWIDKRKPRVATVAVVTAGILLVMAARLSGDGIQWQDFPPAFVIVVGDLMN